VRKLADIEGEEAKMYSGELEAEEDAFKVYIDELRSKFGDGRVGAMEAATEAKAHLEAVIMSVVNRSIGVSSMQANRKRWWTPEVATAVRAKQEAAVAYKLESSVENKLVLIERRRRVATLLRAVRLGLRAKADEEITKVFDEQVDGGTCAGDKKFWTILKKQYMPKVNNGIKMMANEQGEVVVEPEKIAEVFARHYARVGDGEGFSEGAGFDEDHRLFVEQAVAGFVDESRTDEGIGDLNEVLRVAEVVDACKQLKNGKAASPLDNISNELLKYGGPAMGRMLHALFSLQWEVEEKNQTPGVVTSLHKGGVKHNPKHYRPITLLSCMDKLYHRVLNNRLTKVLEKNMLLHEAQNAFRVKRDCLEHALTVHTMIMARKNEGKDTFMFFGDQAQAYDTVWRDGLMFKLWQKGIRGKMFRVIYNMYKRTVSKVSQNNVFSETFSFDQGVAQGDTLSPTLFSIFVDGLLQDVYSKHAGVPISGEGEAQKLVAVMFADDFLGLAESKEELQGLIDSTKEYFGKWRMKANVSKSAVMVVKGKVPRMGRGRPTRVVDSDGEDIRWGELPVPVKDEYKYMGLVLHNSGKWDAEAELSVSSESRKNRAHRSASNTGC
jgi:hypothetical protein